MATKKRIGEHEKRAAVLAAVRGNESTLDIAKRLKVSRALVYSWLKEYRESESRRQHAEAAAGTPKPQPARPAADDRVVRLELENARLREKARALLTLLGESP